MAETKEIRGRSNLDGSVLKLSNQDGGEVIKKETDNFGVGDREIASACGVQPKGNRAVVGSA